VSQYTKSTNFATKDNLPTGDPLKIVKGTEIDTEYNNIATAIATKTDNASAAITGGTIVGITDLAIADGGTGASTATAALNNLLPSQTSAANKYLQSDGTNASWDAVTLSTSDITGTLAVANGGTGVTSSTGTGSVVLSNSPTLVTPTLGAASATSLSVSGSVTLSGGTANAVPYLNGSKVLTSSTALYFDGSNLGVGGSASYRVDLGSATSDDAAVGIRIGRGGDSNSWTLIDNVGGSTNYKTFNTGTPTARWSTSTNGTSFTEQMRLNPTGLGIKNNNPAAALDVTGSALVSGSVTAASFAGALNGTVGATTASTGAFTTLTTSSTVTHNGGTANGVTYLNGSKVLTSGSALTFDGITLGVGISGSAWNTLKAVDLGSGGAVYGTAAQSGILANAYYGSTGFVYKATNGASIYQLVADSHRWSTAASGTSETAITFTEGMRLTSTGLGIGTSNINQKLVISNAGAEGLEIGPNVIAGAPALIAYNRSGSAYVQLTTSALRHAWYASSTEVMRLDSSGNLGLGVTPSAWSGAGPVVEVGTSKGNAFRGAGINDANVESNAYYNAGWKYANTGYANRYAVGNGNGGGHYWYNAASGTAGNAITFTQAMTLDASGNLRLGLTGSIFSSTERMSIQSASGAIGLSINASGSGSYGIDIYGSQATGATSQSMIVFSNSSSSIVGSITSNGTATAYNLTSDQRLKENIQDAESSSSLIDAIQVRKFDWKSDGSHTRYGFVAQELVTVAPEAVHQPEDTEEMMAVDYSKLVPMLVKEIQSLRARVAQLETN